MRRSEKQFPSKVYFGTFLELNCSNFRLNSVKGLRVLKIFKEVKFEGNWGECLQNFILLSMSLLTAVLIKNSHI